jgi:HK97 family phage major capsid protein
MDLKGLRNKRHGVYLQMKELREAAEKADRSFTAEEREKWNSYTTELDAIDERIAFAQKLETGLAGLSEKDAEQRDRDEFELRKRQNTDDDPNRPLTEYEKCQAFTAWALGRQCNDAEAQALARRANLPLGQGTINWEFDLGRGPDGMPLQPARNLQEVKRNDELRRERRAIERERWEKNRETRAQSLTTTAGGFTVPDEMMRALEESLLAFGGMRQVATVISTESGASLPIPMVDDTAQKGVILAENTGAAEQDVTFAQKVMGAFKYSSKMIKVSVELLQDTGINLPQFLGSALGNRIARITNDHFTTGAGTTEPWGVVTRAGNSSVTVASAGVMIFSEPLRLLHSVDPAYRNGASFMCHDSTLLKLRSMVDGQSRPIWEPSVQAGTPGSIFGTPVVINQSMAAYAAAAKVLLYGNFSKYLIRDVKSVEIMRLDERFAEAHQVAFLGFSRHDGDLLDAGTDPVKYLTGL